VKILKIFCMNKFKIIILALVIDVIFTNLIFKNTSFWENQEWKKKWWRVSSPIYHHAILPNIDEIEKWGGSIEKRVITNSIGFFDKENRIVEKDNKSKKRLLLIGDSFIEGAGLPYESTVAGLLDSELNDKYEILNSALGSYSPSIYFKKIEYFINQGYKFDKALVFLDVSDLFDELFIKFDTNGNILTFEETKKTNNFKKYLYKLGRYLRDNTTTFRFFYILSDKTELFKNYLKLKIKTSKEINKNFFKTTRDEVMFYRMTHIDRGFWTYNSAKFQEVEIGLKQAEEYLIKLFKLFKKNNIESTLIIYPWPTQIFYGDKFHQNYWEDFSKKNNIQFLSLYEKFNSNKKKEFIFENFIYGDIHWNKNGTKLVFEFLVDNIKF